MTVILDFLTNLTITVVVALLAFNLFSIVGFALHRHEFVRRVQRKAVGVVSLFRLGVR